MTALAVPLSAGFVAINVEPILAGAALLLRARAGTSTG